MSVPSVKGVLLVSLARAIEDALATSQLHQRQVELSLEADEIDLLEGKVDPARWYPVTSYGRLLELVAGHIVGGDRRLALREIGALMSEDVREIGIYSQVSFQDGLLGGAGEDQIKAFARSTATLHTMIYNIGTTRVEVAHETSSLDIHYEDVAGYPEVARWASEGYTERMATRAVGVPISVESVMVEPNRFTLRFTVNK